MVVVSNIFFDPAVPIRIATTTLAIGTLIGVIAAGITVGVVVSRQPGLLVRKTVQKSDVSIAIGRPIMNNELQQLYDPTATLTNSTSGLNAQMSASFPKTAGPLIIMDYSGAVVSVPDTRRKRQQGSRPSIILLNGSAYFTQPYTSEQIRAAFSNYTQTIVLANNFNRASPGLGTFSSKYSEFTNTYSTNYTLEQVNGFSSISTPTATPSPG